MIDRQTCYPPQPDPYNLSSTHTQDETAALVEARATIQTLEGELRAAKQEAEEAGTRHAFELEQAKLHAQRCEGEQVRFV